MVLRRSGSDIESGALQAAKGHGRAHNRTGPYWPRGLRVCPLPDAAARKNPILVQHLFGRPAGCRVQHARKAGGRTQLSAPALSNKEQSMVIKRHRFKQTHTLQERLSENTERLLEQAKVLPLGSDRSKIDRRITQNKAAIQLCEMLRSPRMQITK